MTIKWIGSPNFDTNRKAIDRIVIHWIVGNLAAADATFQNTTRGTSAHYGVEDDTVHQYVKEEHVAYHAGNYAYNQRSIGIEHSAAPDRAASEKTYKTTAQLVAAIAKRYNIPLDRTHIVRHGEIVATQCPGTMDVDKIIKLAKGEATTPTEPTMPNMYGGLDLSNPESMKPCVDLFNKWKNGGFVEKPEFEKVKIDLEKAKTTNDNLNQQINDRNNDIVQLNAKIGTLNTQVTELTQRVETLTEQAIQLPDLIKQNEHLTDKVKGFQEAETSWIRARAQYEKQITDLKENALRAAFEDIIEKIRNLFKK